MKERTVLIDGDILAYRCGFAAEHKKYHLKHEGGEKIFDGKKAMNKWLKENEPAEYEWYSELEVEPLSFCLSTVKHMIANITKACGATETIIYLSSKKNFRDDIATIAKYKGNRDKTRKPIHLPDIIRYLKEHHNAVTLVGLEADDLLADTQTSLNKADQDSVIASIDKDLLQITGKHYNFVNDTYVYVTGPTARRNLYEQLLKGDRTDNIPGIKGVGDVTAKELLEPSKCEEDMYDVVYEAWEDYLEGDKPPDWMDSYDSDTKEVGYHDWEGNKTSAMLHEIIDEIMRLLTVGIPQGVDDAESESDGV